MHVAGKCFRLTPVKHVFGDSARSSARGNAVTERPHEHDAAPHSLRDGVHDLRNVLNAVQMNAFAARQLVEQPARTLACLTRIEAAVERGNGVLAHMPTDETLSTAALILRDRLQGDAEVTCDGDAAAPVPGLLRQALCVVAVESHALGARAFRLRVADGTGELTCEAQGLQAPGPIATALAGSRVPELQVSAERADGGWTFRWAPLPQ
jgi:hypothetical protein